MCAFSGFLTIDQEHQEENNECTAVLRADEQEVVVTLRGPLELAIPSPYCVMIHWTSQKVTCLCEERRVVFSFQKGAQYWNGGCMMMMI